MSAQRGHIRMDLLEDYRLLTGELANYVQRAKFYRDIGHVELAAWASQMAHETRRSMENMRVILVPMDRS